MHTKEELLPTWEDETERAFDILANGYEYQTGYFNYEYKKFLRNGKQVCIIQTPRRSGKSYFAMCRLLEDHLQGRHTLLAAPGTASTGILRNRIKRLEQYKRKPAFVNNLIDRPEWLRGRCADVVIVDELGWGEEKKDMINQLLPVAPKIFALETPE